MSRGGMFFGILLVAGVGAVGYLVNDVRVETKGVREMVARLASEEARRTSPAAAADLEPLKRVLDEQLALLKAIAEKNAPTPPQSLAQLRAAKPELDAAAVESALKQADPTGRIPTLLFLDDAEALRRFGPPSLTLVNEGRVTWLYRLSGFDKLLRLEFVGGIVLNAFDR